MSYPYKTTTFKIFKPLINYHRIKYFLFMTKNKTSNAPPTHK